MASIILVGVDNSDTAFRAAERAAALAVAFDSELHIVSAFQVATVETIRSLRRSSPERQGIHTAFDSLTEQPAREAQAAASDVEQKLKAAFPSLRTNSRSVEGEPGRVLVREAEEIAADIIVVGNKRVQGPARIFGSIARTVASETDCDLYVVNTQ